MINSSQNSVASVTKTNKMLIAENIEIEVLALAKTFGQEVVNENHILIAACDYLCKHAPEKCNAVIKNKAESGRNIERARDGSGFKPPTIPPSLLARMKQCVSVQDVVDLAQDLSLITEQPTNQMRMSEEPLVQPTSMGDFHEPLGPSVGRLPKLMPNKETAALLIQSFLLKDEFYAWDGPYNTKDYILVTRPGQSMGRLFVTNKRLLFWSDDTAKPHVGLFYSDIQGWKTSWMPMKSRGVIAMVAGRKVVFAANSTAIENAERFINR